METAGILMETQSHLKTVEQSILNSMHEAILSLEIFPLKAMEATQSPLQKMQKMKS